MLPTLLPNCCPAPQKSGYGKSTTAPHRSAELLGVRLLSVACGSVIVNQQLKGIPTQERAWPAH